MKKILIIKSAPDWLFDQCLQHICETYEKETPVSIGLVTRRDVIQDTRCHDIFHYEAGLFRFWKHGLKLIRPIRQKAYDHVIILYNDTTGHGYGSLQLFSHVLGIKRKQYFNKDKIIGTIPSCLDLIIRTWMSALSHFWGSIKLVYQTTILFFRYITTVKSYTRGHK